MHAAHIAYVEVPSHDGVFQYDAAPVTELRRLGRRQPAADAILRIFGADPASTGGVTRDAMASLDAAANALLDLGTAVAATRVLASTWDNDDDHRALWFQLVEGEAPSLTPVSESDLSAVHWAADALARGFLVELQRGRAWKKKPPEDLWSSFQHVISRQMRAKPLIPVYDSRPAARVDAPADPVAAAAAFREELLDRGWPTSDQVGQHNHASARNKAQWAADKRTAGELLGVWSPRDRSYRHPDFQFEGGLLNPKVKPLLVELAKVPGLSPKDDPTGWRRTFWLYGGRTALAKHPEGSPRTPAEVFPHDPDAVIELARVDATAKADPNDSW